MVHLDGFSIVSLKLAMNSSMRSLRFWREVKLARRRSFRTRIENQISIWLSHEACFGVKCQVMRWL